MQATIRCDMYNICLVSSSDLRYSIGSARSISSSDSVREMLSSAGLARKEEVDTA